MRKNYLNLSITPLQLDSRSDILQGSVVQTDAAVRTTGQVVNEITLDDDTTFQQEWD